MKRLAAVALLVASSFAAGQRPTTDEEIDLLIGKLKVSGCKFNRNGSWYEAPKAAEHLQQKREYLTKKGKIKTAEDFIRLAGTESSMSGKAYRVACPEVPEVDSKVWLQKALGAIRATTYQH